MSRFLDALFSAWGLILLGPWLLLIAVIILVTDGHPVFFRHHRMGRKYSEFSLLKFRTMRHEPAEAGPGSFQAGDSSRVTPIGRCLRTWKLDELPQLWNVVKGDMSIVGPRPEVKKWIEAYPQRWSAVLTVRPGITDPASIEFRNEEKLLARAADPEEYYRDVILPRKLDLYEAYVEKKSFRGDIMIILRTAQAVVRNK
jgi:lipopolysaccharide/colanic/teichoic acid biosynthesis glycosyltransferase